MSPRVCSTYITYATQRSSSIWAQSLWHGTKCIIGVSIWHATTFLSHGFPWHASLLCCIYSTTYAHTVPVSTTVFSCLSADTISEPTNGLRGPSATPTLPTSLTALVQWLYASVVYKRVSAAQAVYVSNISAVDHHHCDYVESCRNI